MSDLHHLPLSESEEEVSSLEFPAPCVRATQSSPGQSKILQNARRPSGVAETRSNITTATSRKQVTVPVAVRKAGVTIKASNTSAVHSHTTNKNNSPLAPGPG